MRGRYFFVPGEVGDRTRNAQDALMRACREVKALGSTFEQIPGLVPDLAGPFQGVTFEARIGYASATELYLSCVGHTRCDDHTWLRVRIADAQDICRRP